MSTSQTSSVRTGSKKIRILFFVLGLMSVGFFLLSLAFGSAEMSIPSALSALSHGNFSNTDFLILFRLRMPRTFACILSGCALAVSGVIIQAVLHNPMAAPNVIGVNSGAGLSAVLTAAVFPGLTAFMPLSCFLGALGACLLIYAISARTRAGKLTVTLVGIAVSSVLNACINTVKILYPDCVYDADLFMIGGFSGVTYEKLLPAFLIIAVCATTAFFLAGDTDVLSLGENTAMSLGMNVTVMRFLLLVLASALAGAAVSFSGLLGFVGLLVPHIMRRFVGNRHRLLIPSCGLAGSILVLACDLFSRTAFAPYEVPVGIVLSFIGGLFFISLVLTSKRGVSL